MPDAAALAAYYMSRAPAVSAAGIFTVYSHIIHQYTTKMFQYYDGGFMENRIKKYFICGIVFTSVLGTLSHFFYQWTGKNPLIALISPVNESTWEHMKLLFFPMLIYSLYASARLKETFPSLPAALAVGILTGTLSIPVLFYTYTGIIGRNIAAADIAVFFGSVLIAWGTAWKLKDSGRIFRYRILFYALNALLCVMFFIFTFRVPGPPLFQA